MAYRSEVEKYLDEISKVGILSRAEELTLIPAAKSGDREAFDRVISANLRFVVTIAREYENNNISLMDIISEGNLGLIRALSTFDPQRGYKFITYAKWWIRQSIVYSLIYKGHLVRVPQSQLRKLKTAKKSTEGLRKKLEDNPIDPNLLDKIQENEIYMNSITKTLGAPKSLESPLADDESDRFMDVLPDANQPAPDNDVDNELFKKTLDEAFKVLSKREVHILRKLFGLNYEEKSTLEEIGQIYGISRERVRQIKNEALEKLRNASDVLGDLRLFCV